jgi:uncharacterized membrane protein YecN with MAPEG domain
MIKIVPVYAALLAFVFIALSAHVIRFRYKLKVAIGANGDAGLERAMRVHANFVEYAPLGLLLLAFAEMQGAYGLLIHGLSAALLLGRCAHAYGMAQESEDFRLRGAGMALTFGVIVTTSALLLVMPLL